MKNILLSNLLFVLLLSALPLCAQQEQPRKPTRDTLVFKGVNNSACALEIDFGSYGSGIDGRAFDEITALISRRNLASTSRNMGREGEKRLCLPLTELKAAKRKRFIRELRKIAARSQLVSLSIR